MRIFLDANILFSACKLDSHMRKFLSLLEKNHELITSDYAHEEASRNLERKQIKWKNNLKHITKNLNIVASYDLNEPVELAQKDRVILGSAIQHKCNYLITGDKKDFGHLFEKTIKGVKILTPTQMYQEIFQD